MTTDNQLRRRVPENGKTGEKEVHHKRRKLNIAPLNTPLKNRLETVGVIWHTICIPFFIIVFLLVLLVGWVAWAGVVLPYYVWWYGFDLHTPTNGKAVYRTRAWMRNLIIWEWFVNYFPIRFHKSVELEPTFTTVKVDENDDEQDLISDGSRTIIDKIFKRLGLSKRTNEVDLCTPPPGLEPKSRFRRIQTGPRYIFGYHPHGVISMGAMGSFATNAIRNEPFEPPLHFLKPLFHDTSKGPQLFPGIGLIFPLTLTTQFTIPFYRDYLMSLGLTSASARNIKSLINNGDNSVCIVVGGAQELLLNQMVSRHTKIGNGYVASDDEEDDTQNRKIRLVLSKRKGFVKLAIELGNVSLVPTFAFGEADIYRLMTPKPGSIGFAFQRWLKTHFSFTLPFFSARGIFIYDFGLLPYRNPINVVTGNPIHISDHALQDYLAEHPQPEEERLPGAKPKIPQALLDHYHKLYVDELKRVYEENKERFGYGDVELCIIE